LKKKTAWARISPKVFNVNPKRGLGFMKVHFFATAAVGEKTQIWNLLELLNSWLEKHDDCEIKHIQQNMTAYMDSVYIIISVWYEEKK
jgi:hypothetical protein